MWADGTDNMVGASATHISAGRKRQRGGTARCTEGTGGTGHLLRRGKAAFELAGAHDALRARLDLHAASERRVAEAPLRTRAVGRSGRSQLERLRDGIVRRLCALLLAEVVEDSIRVADPFKVALDHVHVVDPSSVFAIACPPARALLAWLRRRVVRSRRRPLPGTARFLRRVPA